MVAPISPKCKLVLPYLLLVISFIVIICATSGGGPNYMKGVPRGYILDHINWTGGYILYI